MKRFFCWLLDHRWKLISSEIVPGILVENGIFSKWKCDWCGKKDVIENLCRQFAFESKTKNGKFAITTGGLSALEDAFEYLGWSDPQAYPGLACFCCEEQATCGTPTPKNYTVGYASVCGAHYQKISGELEMEKRGAKRIS